MAPAKSAKIFESQSQFPGDHGCRGRLLTGHQLELVRRLLKQVMCGGKKGLISSMPERSVSDIKSKGRTPGKYRRGETLQRSELKQPPPCSGRCGSTARRWLHDLFNLACGAAKQQC